MRRVPGLFVAAGLALTFVSGACAESTGAGVDGAQVFASDCTTCHPSEQVVAGARRRVADGDPEAILRAFLEQHFTPDAERREAVVAHLVRLLHSEAAATPGP